MASSIIFEILLILVDVTTNYHFSYCSLSFQKAEKALKYYKGCKGRTVAQSAALFEELERIKLLTNQRQNDKKFHFSDFCKYIKTLNSA